MLMNGRSVIPQTVVISAEGRLVSHWNGYDSGQSRSRLRDAIDRALAETGLRQPNLPVICMTDHREASRFRRRASNTRFLRVSVIPPRLCGEVWSRENYPQRCTAIHCEKAINYNPSYTDPAFRFY